MIIERIDGARNRIDTCHGRHYRIAWKKAQKLTNNLEGLVIDPFARNCKWADITNDLNPNTEAKYHLDVIEFLELVLKNHGERSVKCLLFDPPFSSSQYQKYAKDNPLQLSNIYSTPGKIKSIFKLVEKLIMPGGVIVKLGYNTTRPIKGYELNYLSITCFGGNHNDVMCSIWFNPNETLLTFGEDNDE